ncbi:MAG: hypothetical protein RLZZ08_1715, partial [Pseudomonadota bacterium]
LAPAEQASEALLMGLRLAEGIDPGALACRFGQNGPIVERQKLDFYTGLGLMWQDAGRIGATPQGMAVLDGLLGELVPAELVA